MKTPQIITISSGDCITNKTKNEGKKGINMEANSNNNGLAVFNNPEFGRVRVVMKDDEPWFVAKDVAEALGYSRTEQAIKNHCKHVELFKPLESRGLEISPFGANIIPKSDIYRLKEQPNSFRTKI